MWYIAEALAIVAVYTFFPAIGLKANDLMKRAWAAINRPRGVE